MSYPFGDCSAGRTLYLRSRFLRSKVESYRTLTSAPLLINTSANQCQSSNRCNNIVAPEGL